MVSVIVSLNPMMVSEARRVAQVRQSSNLLVGRKDRYGCSIDDGDRVHLLGASGEAAFAQYTGIRWTGNLGNLKAKDVGKFQVRTRKRHGWSLILHPADPDDDVFVLVASIDDTLRNFEMMGWCPGWYGKKERFWADLSRKGRPAFFVPQGELLDIETLPNIPA